MLTNEQRHRLTQRELSLFFLPLALTSFVVIITHSLFNAGLARLPSPEIMIAAFAVAKSMMHIFQSPTMMMRQTITSLVDHRRNFRRTVTFLISIVFGVVLILILIAYTGISRYLFEHVMGLRGQTLDEAVRMLRVLAFFPALVSSRDFFAAFSIKFRTTPLITLASVIRIIYVFIFINLIDKITFIAPAYLAALMFLGAVATEAIAMAIGTRVLNKSITKSLDALDREQPDRVPTKLTYLNIVMFFMPLIATTLIHTTLTPIVNAGLARTHEPDLALSVFSVAWNLGAIFHSPFGTFHQVPLNYMDGPLDPRRKSVIRFALITSLSASLALAIVAFTDIGYFILRQWIGASHQISVLSADVLKLMAVLPLLIVAREYYWGILMKKRTTRFIWIGKAVNLITLISTITVMTLIGPANAAMVGVIGMIACELAEFLFLFAMSKRSLHQTVSDTNE